MCHWLKTKVIFLLCWSVLCYRDKIPELITYRCSVLEVMVGWLHCFEYIMEEGLVEEAGK